MFMKIGIILQSNNSEHIWNTFRFGITSLKANHGVTIFLMSEGSELDTIADTEHFDISKKVAEYKEVNSARPYPCAGAQGALRAEFPLRTLGSQRSLEDSLTALLRGKTTVFPTPFVDSRQNSLPS